MKVYALVGKSGTGKSYQAMNLCRERNIEGIIDDGLFIVGNGILAGVSAKRQTTRIGAVKTALFTDEGHKNAVKSKIQEVSPSSILIIGTSDGMTNKIAERLELPEIKDTVYIESITSENERETAKKQRDELGKHLIPVPTFQIKREFSGYFVDPLRVFRAKGRSGRGAFAEKSVVRPTYSYMGDYIISDRVIGDIVECIVKSRKSKLHVTRVQTENTKSGIRLTIVVVVRYGAKIIETAKTFQEQVAWQVGLMTAFNIDCVDIEVKDLG
ncbi:MAG: Asp23/Gls24 family envelope stress response protein [Clostridiales bacterium]|nr:Asp23/Gls24 family envelope stress response protein [Clostridiales bacterium]